MSGFEFRMDPNWERNLKKMVNEGVRRLAKDLERALNALRPTYRDRPLAEVKAAVAATWKRNTDGGYITDPELTQFAEAIQAGAAIHIDAEQLAA